MERTRIDEVAAQVRRFLAGELSRDELQDWLVPFVWDPELVSVDPQADDLISSIQLELSEFTGGYLTEDELRDHLRTLLPATVSIFVNYGAQESPYGSSQQDTAVAIATVGGLHPFSITPQPSSAGT
jgi:hypothetical protein